MATLARHLPRGVAVEQGLLRFFRAGSLLLLAALVAPITGCGTIDALMVNSEKARSQPGYWYEQPAPVPTGDSEAEADHFINRANDYCAGVARAGARQEGKTRAIKNIMSVVGVVSGTIIAPVLVEGSAIRAWSGVAGASAGAISRMYDSATVSPMGMTGERTTLVGEIIRINREIRDLDLARKETGRDIPREKRRLANELIYFCALNDHRPRRPAEVAAASAAAVQPAANSAGAGAPREVSQAPVAAGADAPNGATVSPQSQATSPP